MTRKLDPGCPRHGQAHGRPRPRPRPARRPDGKPQPARKQGYYVWRLPARSKRGKWKRSVAGVAAIFIVSGMFAGSTQARSHTRHAVSTGGHAGFTMSLPHGKSGGYTQQSWARALLKAGGWKATACSTAAVMAWEHAEEGNWGNAARYNPLNTTYDGPVHNGVRTHSWEHNGKVTKTINHISPGVGVRAYRSWGTGLQATILTLHNGHYATILRFLRAGNDAQGMASAVTASPWGTGTFSATC